MSRDKQIIHFLLETAAIRLMSGSPAKSALQKDAQSTYNRIRANYTAEDVKGIDLIANILKSLINQLARCQDVTQLEQAVKYIEALEKGEVLLAEDDGLALQPAPPKVTTEYVNPGSGRINAF